MGRYSVDIEKNARKQLAELYKSGNKADIKKVEVIFSELEEHLDSSVRIMALISLSIC